MSVEKFREEVAMKQRFEFGKNWKHFLDHSQIVKLRIRERG